MKKSTSHFKDLNVQENESKCTCSLTAEEKDKFLTTVEAAEFLRIGAQALLNMTSNGQVPVYKLGRRNRYRLQDLKYLLLTNRRGNIQWRSK